MTIKEALSLGESTLSQVPDPQVDARRLLAHVTGRDGLRLLLSGTDELTPQQEQRYTSLLLCRAQWTPLQYLTGSQCFYGLDIQTDGRALIPRPETELLCELGLRFLRGRSSPIALDLCTGSGAIAVTLKHECPAAQVHAADLSRNALDLARANAQKNNTDIVFHQGDLFQAVLGLRFDLILSNPPYIPSRDCRTLQPEVLREPLMALDGGVDGLDFYRRIAGEAAAFLLPGGMLAMEVGDGEARAVKSLLEAAGFHNVAVHNDLAALPRMVSANFT